MSDKEALQLNIQNILKDGGIEFYDFETRQFLREYYKVLPEERIIEKAKKRADGYPLQYIFGNWEFYGLLFSVGEGVLIPRADTETLVDTAIELIKKGKFKTVVDLCSGSGAVAVAVDKNTDASVTAVELSDKAFRYLEENIKKNNSSVTAVKADATVFSGSFDLCLCNPPYIKTEVIKELSREVRFEPTTALDGGSDGLAFYRKITQNAKNFLNPQGVLAYEIGYDQADAVSKILSENGFSDIHIIKDLSGNQRVIFGTADSL